MENNKEVYFDKYCQSCKHNNTKEYKDPCNDCLAEPNNINSHRPIRYENKNKKVIFLKGERKHGNSN